MGVIEDGVHRNPEWHEAGPDWSDIDLALYQPGRHGPLGDRQGLKRGDDHYEPCCSGHEARTDSCAAIDAGLFVPDGRHIVFLYWSEIPYAGIHTGWGGSDLWRCRCGWRPWDEVENATAYPGQPPFGDAGTPERRARIAWDVENTRWHPSSRDLARVHAYTKRGIFVDAGEPRL